MARVRPATTSSDRSRRAQQEGEHFDQVVGVEDRAAAVGDQEVAADRRLPIGVAGDGEDRDPYSIARFAVITHHR
jgi:hypothetical protein